MYWKLSSLCCSTSTGWNYLCGVFGPARGIKQGSQTRCAAHALADFSLKFHHQARAGTKWQTMLRRRNSVTTSRSTVPACRRSWTCLRIESGEVTTYWRRMECCCKGPY
ncbi:hypothetical protein JG687_00012064 [Phytophthora cactorum]|uniref:Uncharacterized protein n=1 Tax=Phytophthora cactorum TaxID=29920 RepID=A0A8T1U834_9STRA|nr:hypothetical protein JG687_00012064 [Phytophthora cactorum]